MTLTIDTVIVGEKTITLLDGQLELRPMPDESVKGKTYRIYADADGQRVHIFAIWNGRVIRHEIEPVNRFFCDWCKGPIEHCASVSCDDTPMVPHIFNPLTGKWE